MHFRPCTGGLLALGCGFATLLVSSVAHAQQPGWSTDRFDPAPAGDTFFQTHFPTYSAPGPIAPRFALTTAYAYRPLVATVVDPAGGTSQQAVIEHSVVTHAQLNVHVAHRVGIEATLPIYWTQIGAADPSYPVHASGSPALGDLRLGARVRIAGEASRDPLSFHLGISAYMGFLDFSSSSQGTTDAAFRARLFAVGAGTIGMVRWSATVGVHARPGVNETYAHVGSELYANAAVGVTFSRRRFLAGLEGAVSTDVNSAFQSGHVNAEAWVVLRARLLGDAVQAGLGAGPGITQAIGTPAFRAMFTLAFTPQMGHSAYTVTPRVAASPTPRARENTPGGTSAGGAVPAATGAPESSPETTPESSPEGNAQPPEGVAPAGEAGETGESTEEDLPALTLHHFCDVPNAQACSVGDRDHDGINEPLDQCADTPVGPNPDPTRTGCPDPDRDGDAVTDHADLCPDQSVGTLPDPHRAGCPLPDADGDRITDAEDHCPDRPGAPSTDPMINGCPGLVQLDAQVLQILQPIFFAVGRDAIETRSDAVLRSVCDALLARTEIRLMRIEGHTDDNGNDEINVDLSHRRAAAVVRWLIEHGIAPARLQSEGFGSSRPRVAISPGLNRTQRDEARATNRRVEFEIVPDAPPPGATTTTNTTTTTPTNAAPAQPANQPTPTQTE